MVEVGGMILGCLSSACIDDWSEREFDHGARTYLVEPVMGKIEDMQWYEVGGCKVVDCSAYGRKTLKGLAELWVDLM